MVKQGRYISTGPSLSQFSLTAALLLPGILSQSATDAGWLLTTAVWNDISLFAITHLHNTL